MTIESVLDAIAPEFTSDSRKVVFIALASARVSKSVFGDLHELAIANLAAHMLTVASSGSGQAVAGPVVQKDVGNVSLKYGSANGTGTSSGDYLEASKYGKELQRLTKERVVTTFSPGMTE